MYNFVNRRDGVIVTKGQQSAVIEFLFQPICNLSESTTQFYEILSRVTSQTGETYNSQDFFENIGDDFIKELCLNQIISSKLLKIESTVSINITLSCLSDRRFVEEILSFNSRNIALEINELNCYSSSNDINSNISLLQENGIMIWLDDYHENNECANLSLGKIQWDMIKIDKRFLHYNGDDLMAIQALSYVLMPFTKQGLIFEGIETATHSSLVKSTGAFGQGFFYSIPQKWHGEILRGKYEHNIKKNIINSI
ncbi:EAL domain-containing protein [Vibrio alfacsensis]|uniref:EAL domain-containing protein n=1 Tax=Vibrio alfacsensis TaxID=1074311 RepID=UPI001BEEAA3A|nr:EAL domain-containing protein [Vibrio alfacsensis]BCN23145.1 diguanylate phosphodiesterase [Vibrio alfacsensis]